MNMKNDAAAAPVPLLLLRRQQVEAAVGLSRSALYDRLARGEFPAPVRIGSAVRWRTDDLQRWVDELPTASRRQAA